MPDLMDTHIENREIVQPHHANTHGTVHGGTVTKWMDEVGAMAAMHFAGSNVVTARMEQVNFRRPIPVGDTALVESYVYDSGETSIRVRCRVYREHIETGETELTTESHLVYVAVDEDADSVRVPDLETATERGRELLAAARASDETHSD